MGESPELNELFFELDKNNSKRFFDFTDKHINILDVKIEELKNLILSDKLPNKKLGDSEYKRGDKTKRILELAKEQNLQIHDNDITEKSKKIFIQMVNEGFDTTEESVRKTLNNKGFLSGKRKVQ